MITANLKGVPEFNRKMKAFDASKRKALEFVIRRRAFELRNVLKKEMKEGRAGDHKLEPLSFLARGLGILTTNRLRKDTRLARLQAQVFYKVDKSSLTAQVGFVEGRTIPFLRRMAKVHATGFERTITESQRKFIIKQGARRISGHRYEAFVTDKPFFIRKTTKTFKTPASPIIEPFWNAHRNEAIATIRSDFRRKMAGERI